MKPCTLTVKNGLADWCEDHKRYHHGHHRKWALGNDPVSIGYRVRWELMSMGIVTSPDNDDITPYTLAEVVASYTKTLTAHIANGRRMLPMPMRQHRRVTCDSCKYRDAENDSCKICRCSLSPNELQALLIGDKLKWEVGECPAHKWDKWHFGTVTGKHGVVIGSYGMPGVVELSIAMIRKTCGDVPILIADDSTPESMGRQRLILLPKKYPGVSLVMNSENLGHAPGDIRAYRNGLQWAKENGIGFICKLSQRFIFLKDRWLQEWCEEMEQEGAAVSSQRAVHLNLQFPMRSECVFLDVKRCMASPRFMTRIDPEGGKIATSAEDWLNAGVHEGGLGPVLRCRMMPVDRFGKHPDVIWHNSNSSDDYHEAENAYTRLAEQMGIDLGPEFSGAGWHVITAHRPDAGYHML